MISLPPSLPPSLPTYVYLPPSIPPSLPGWLLSACTLIFHYDQSSTRLGRAIASELVTCFGGGEGGLDVRGRGCFGSDSFKLKLTLAGSPDGLPLIEEVWNMTLSLI